MSPRASDRRLAALLAGLLAVLGPLAGCQRGEELGHVTGKVTFQGQPVTSGMVIFANKEKGVYMTAPLDAQGAFEVIMAQGAGLPLGTAALQATAMFTEVAAEKTVWSRGRGSSRWSYFPSKPANIGAPTAPFPGGGAGGT